MPVTSTNAIRHFADKVRGLAGQNRELILSAQDARNLNHEIQQVLAQLVELQNQAETGRITVEVGAPKF